MNGFGFIAITREYLEDDDESVFTPTMWKVYEKEEDCYGPCMALSEEGREFVNRWCDDYSVGYDLCYGRAKGLAAKYSRYDVWNEIVENPEYRIGEGAEW